MTQSAKPSKRCKCGHYVHMKGFAACIYDHDKPYIFEAEDEDKCKDCPNYFDWAKELNKS